MVVLSLKNVKKTFKQGFKKNEVLRGISFEVEAGDVFAFLGPNGAGKTTTLKAILGFIYCDEGEILLFGEKILNNRKILRKIGYAPEQAYYYEHLTGAEFLTYMGLISGIKKSEIKSKVDYYLDLVGLSFAKKTLIKNYSKGMKQRLGIASSIIHSPELVFFDEPMSGLDPLGRKLVKDLISDLNNQGMTVFFNTHILSDVEEIANRFAIINKGEIVYQGKISDLKKPLEDFFMEKVSCEKIV